MFRITVQRDQLWLQKSPFWLLRAAVRFFPSLWYDTKKIRFLDKIETVFL